MPEFTALFNPSSIAIYGISENTDKLSYKIYANLLNSKYSGSLVFINPKHTILFKKPVYPDLKHCPEKVEMAIFVIPAEFVETAFEDAAESGIRSAIIISAGFAEIGKEGKELEEKIKKIAEKYKIILLGPNCLGLIVPENKLNASFAPQNPMPGNIAFVSQSGAICTALLDMATKRDLGFSYFVSIGNKTVIKEVDLFEYWLNDDSVKVIGAYIEEFDKGIELIETISTAKNKKPIIILNPGKSKASQTAIRSHTGSIANPSDVITAALTKVGVIQVNSLQDMFNTLMAFSWGEREIKNDIVILTNAGGPGIMLTDQLASNNINLTVLSEKTKNELVDNLGPNIAVNNPIDILGDAKADKYRVALSILSNAEEVKTVIVLLTPQAVTEVKETGKVIHEFYRNSNIQIIPLFIGGDFVSYAMSEFYSKKIPAFIFDEDCQDSIKNVVNYYKFLNHNSYSQVKIVKKDFKIDLSKWVSSEPQILPENIVLKLAKQQNISTPNTYIIANLEHLLPIKNEIKYPVALKATSKDILHKTDLNALSLNINSYDELVQEFVKLKREIIRKTGKVNTNILIQKMVKAKIELFLGISRDGDSQVYQNHNGFGHLMIFGYGGIYTEVFDDFSKALLPLSKAELENMVKKTKVSKILYGTRGIKKLAIEKLLDTMISIQNMVLSYPEIYEIDMNPVMLSETECNCVDVKIIVKK